MRWGVVGVVGSWVRLFFFFFFFVYEVFCGGFFGGGGGVGFPFFFLRKSRKRERKEVKGMNGSATRSVLGGCGCVCVSLSLTAWDVRQSRAPPVWFIVCVGAPFMHFSYFLSIFLLFLKKKT